MDNSEDLQIKTYAIKAEAESLKFYAENTFHRLGDSISELEGVIHSLNLKFDVIANNYENALNRLNTRIEKYYKNLERRENP